MDPGLQTAAFIFIGVLVFAALFAGGYAILRNPGIEKRLKDERELQGKRFSRWREYLNKKFGEVLKPLASIVPRSPDEMSRLERRLVSAGFRRKDATVLFYGARVALTIAVLIALSAAGYLKTNPVLCILVSILLGAIIPDLWLISVIRRRTDRIQAGLPDTLDLAVVCVEAGLGLDQSLMRIGQEIRVGYPDLSDELNLLVLEVNAGRKRGEALRNLGNRTNSKDLKSLAAILVQTDRFGTSIAQALRTFSDGLRTLRRQRAEEHAAKMAIKMLFPLVLCIFPALFVVILGPAAIRIIDSLGPVFTSR